MNNGKCTFIILLNFGSVFKATFMANTTTSFDSSSTVDFHLNQTTSSW